MRGVTGVTGLNSASVEQSVVGESKSGSVAGELTSGSVIGERLGSQVEIEENLQSDVEIGEKPVEVIGDRFGSGEETESSGIGEHAGERLELRELRTDVRELQRVDGWEEEHWTRSGQGGMGDGVDRSVCSVCCVDDCSSAAARGGKRDGGKGEVPEEHANGGKSS